MKKHPLAFMVLACSAGLFSGAVTASYDKSLYIGGGLGVSYFDPETNNTGYRIENDKDLGWKMYLGYDLSERLGVEAYYADMGEADMAPSGKIGYADYGLSGVYYFYKPQASREGLSTFARLGLGRMKNVTGLDYERENDTHLMFGAGLEYGLGGGFAVRADLDLYDKDAQLITMSLLKRFGKSVPVKVVEPKPEPLPLVTVPEPEPVIEPPKDSDGDGIFDPQDQCPETVPGEKVDARGCVLETVIELKGVTFALNSAELVGESDKILDAMAETLKRYPEQRVAVAGYTDSQGDEAYNQRLSARRANTVREYLVGKGVNTDMLTSKGYGEENPVADNGTAEGRALNRRVELHLQK